MTTKIKIQKNVPRPTGKSRLLADMPWNEMEIGDSFAIPDPDRARGKSSSVEVALRSAGQYWLGKGGCSVRRVVEKGNPVLRVWRIK